MNRFATFVVQRKDELDIKYSDIARELTLAGYTITKQGVGSWVTTNRKPDILNPVVRQALCRVFRIDEATLLNMFGLDMQSYVKSPEARYAAELIDSMSDEKRKMALGILEQIRE